MRDVEAEIEVSTGNDTIEREGVSIDGLPGNEASIGLHREEIGAWIEEMPLIGETLAKERTEVRAQIEEDTVDVKVEIEAWIENL